MVSFSSSTDSSHVAMQVEPKSNVQLLPPDAVPAVSAVTSQSERIEIAAQKGMASTALRANHHPASSRSKNEAARERKKSDPPTTPQMTPYISKGVRAPYRVRREVLSDDEEEAGRTQTVWQIHPKDKKKPKLEPYQVLQNGNLRLVDNTIRSEDGRIYWKEKLRDGRVMWVERLPDGRTRWFV